MLGQPLTADQIRREFNVANRTFRSCQKASIPLRMKTYQDLLEHYEEDTNPLTLGVSRRKAKIVQRTINTEIVRSQFQGLRRVLKPSQSSGISKLLVPRRGEGPNDVDNTYHLLQSTHPDDLVWETIVEREQLEQQLLEYNRESFRAASESPLGHGILFDAITFSSLSPTSAAILNGYIPPDLNIDDHALNELLASFATPPSVSQKGEIPTIFSEDDVRYGFGSWRESTSTSPSGRHLGHYKAIIQHPELLRSLTLFFEYLDPKRYCSVSME
jgi:hypothetical protein